MTFTEAFADHLSTTMPDHRCLIVSGDFNIHVNDLANDDAVFFIDAMSALGLDQHVHTSTHQAGNILDLVLTNSNHLPISKCVSSDFISDHRAVVCQTSLGNAPLSAKKIKVRRITPEGIDKLASSLNTDRILSICELENAVQELEFELTTKFNDEFPEVEKSVIFRLKVPWFTVPLKEQRLVVRRRERAWLRYSQDHHWAAFRRERTRYRNMLRFYKTQFFSLAVRKAKGDTRALYQLANNLTSKVTENPLPPCNSDEDLANEFSEFFSQQNY